MSVEERRGEVIGSEESVLLIWLQKPSNEVFPPLSRSIAKDALLREPIAIANHKLLGVMIGFKLNGNKHRLLRLFLKS